MVEQNSIAGMLKIHYLFIVPSLFKERTGGGISKF